MSVAQKIKAVLADGKPRTPDEIHAELPGVVRETVLLNCNRLKNRGEIVPVAGHAGTGRDGRDGPIHHRFVLAEVAA